MADLDEFLAAAEGMVNAEQGAKAEPNRSETPLPKLFYAVDGCLLSALRAKRYSQPANAGRISIQFYFFIFRIRIKIF